MTTTKKTLQINLWGQNGLFVMYMKKLTLISVWSSGLSAVGGTNRHSGETEGGRNEDLLVYESGTKY